MIISFLIIIQVLNLSNLKKKFINILILVLGIFFLAGWLVLYFHETHIKSITLDKADFSTDSFTYSLDADGTNGEKVISGWIVKTGTSVDTCSINVILKENNSTRAYILPTEVVKREDVTINVGEGNNYDYSGFKALADNVKSERKYTLCFRLEINSVIYYYNTHQTITL